MRKRELLFPAILVVGFLVLLEVTGERNDGVSQADASKGYGAEVSRGAALYVEYACIQCHGLGGKGRSDVQQSAPSLVTADFKRSFPLDAAVVAVIKNGSAIQREGAGSMPAWNGILPEEDMWAIAAYIRAGLPNLGVPLPPTDTGEQIYQAFACVKCHGSLGTGGVKNVGVSDPAHRTIPPLGGPEFKKKFESPDRVRQILLSGQLVEGGKPGVVYAPAWGRIGTAEQIEKVIRYLYGY